MQMDFLSEMKWRNMLHDQTPGVEDHLKDGMKIAYIGFDPTAPSLQLGNFVQIMVLKFFQMAGHQPVILMGGATGRIGDPSGKSEERKLKSYDELDSNLSFQMKQFEKFLDFEGPNKAIIVNNLDFYKDMDVLSFLRNVGKTLTVNYMMSKDSVKNRLESGLSFTEFSYQLLQAYDFQCLYDDMNCTLQMGGSDQWGNITSGTEFIRRNVENGKAYAVTSKLLTKADGKKFGKSEGGNVWLDAGMTSPYKFYQFWINSDDRDISTYMRTFSLKSHEEILVLEDLAKSDARQVKQILAEELTQRVHSSNELSSVQKVSQLLFNPKSSNEYLKSLNAEEWQMVEGEIPSFEIDANQLSNGLSITELLTEHTNILQSKGEARRSIKGNAVSVNKIKIQDADHSINNNDLLIDSFLMIDNGKKNKYLIRVKN